MTMRWKRSRWVPRAWATAALIGSAWDTTTTTPPACAARSRCDGADDARLHVGEALAAGEPEPARVAVHRPPLGQLHQRLQLATGPVAEVALQQPSSICTFSSRAAPMAWPSPGRARGRGVHGVDLRQLGDALGRRLGLGAALVGQVQARARPGRTLPVVGVWPWRTSSTRSRGRVAVLRGAMVGTPAYRRSGGLARIRRAPTIVACRACPRLVDWREQVALDKRAALPRRGVLGPAGARLRRPRRQGAGRGPGAGRPRWQPHRAGVHRRPVG